MRNPHSRGQEGFGSPVAVVTGAGGGLGREVVLRLARDGLPVACADVDAEGLSATAQAVERHGVDCTSTVVDIADEARVLDWRDEVADRLGCPQILVNSGGVLDRRASSEVTLDDFMSIVRVNLGGSYATARAFAPGMRDAGWGRIVNVASIAGLTGYPYSAYAASKAGVVNLTRSLLGELWASGVTVNAVCPGAMETSMLDHRAAGSMTDQTPAGHLADPAEVADTVAFLCSAGAGSINGSAIVIDGGATAFFAYRDGAGDALV